MTKFHQIVERVYDKFILAYPTWVLLGLLAVVSFLGYQAQYFKLDASADTLVIENDKDLRYARLIRDRYGVENSLILTYSAKGDLFSDQSLNEIKRLRDELAQLERVSSVLSIVDVPLLESPPVPVKELASNIKTLLSPDVDKELARREFSASPLYQNLIISAGLKTTALQVNFKINIPFREVLSAREALRIKSKSEGLTREERLELKNAEAQIEDYFAELKQHRRQDIAAVRAIMDKYRPNADLFLGGVHMIADDMIRYIENDLKVFGLGVLFFLVVSLSIIFKRIQWIVLPLICCALAVISMMGLLGLFGWEVTVISSNFISLQLIITMAIVIHLIVRYRGLLQANPDADQRTLVLDTVRLMITPCAYAALTTIAGFGSLLLCDILPVINFGWMMSAGIVVSLIVTFILFPVALLKMPKERLRVRRHALFALTPLLARFTEKYGRLILTGAVIVLVFSCIGISRLVVENSFIDHFKKSTEIYQGMKIIDQKLGGTTPLDVLVEFDVDTESALEPSTTTGDAVATDDDSELAEDAEVDDFDSFDEFESDEDEEKYWFTSEKMTTVMRIHDYLESLPETGKVLSLGTMLKIAEKMNKGRPLDNFQLALLYSELPEEFRSMVLKPYVSIAHNQVRYTLRIRDSQPGLKRNEFLKKVARGLESDLGLDKKYFHLAGLMVLYNNMLQSLFGSQILTLGFVVLALITMFLILFRSLKIALIAIAPNVLAISFVLGVMGWMKIPLDMMTITIAAISIGIAVDNTIHYIYRFIYEFKREGNYIATVHHCHGSIGYAMYFTSVTIIIGFSILALSNFIPSIYFGLLTGLAMLIALASALTLLPRLIVVFKPFGPEHDARQ